MKQTLLSWMIIALTSLLIMLQIICGVSTNNLNTLNPLILIPGAGGNQLEAKLTGDYKPSSLLCDRWYPLQKDHDGWFRMWFDPSVLIPPFTSCFAHRMTLHFKPHLDDYFNAPGVLTRVPQFGSTQSLLYLDPHLK